MRSLSQFLRQPALHVAIFCFYVLLLSWPCLSAVGAWHGGISLFVFLFVNWVLIIVLLWAITRSLKDDHEDEEKPE